jgi:hypothetical protein
MKPMVRLAASLLLFSLPARAQLRGATVGSSSINSAGSLKAPPLAAPASNPTVFRAIAVSGSSADFVPSSFLTYDRAVARGVLDVHYVYVPYDQVVTSSPPQFHSLYVPYDQAIAKGAAALAAEPKSLAQAARELRSETGSKPEATFVEDSEGRIVRQ